MTSPVDPGSCDITTADPEADYLLLTMNPNLPPRRSAYALPHETGLMVYVTEWFAGTAHSHTTYEMRLHGESVGVYERSASAYPC